MINSRRRVFKDRNEDYEVFSSKLIMVRQYLKIFKGG